MECSSRQDEFRKGPRQLVASNKKAMEPYNRQGRLSKLRQIAKARGLHSLLDLTASRLLITLSYSCLPFGFNSTEDLLRWLQKHSNQYEVYSFDLFDTLLRRRIDPPELIKRLSAEHMCALLARCGIHTSPGNILTQRSKVEAILLQQAVAKGKDADFCLDDVVAETLKLAELHDSVDANDIVRYEVGLEKKATEPMPGAIASLSYLKSCGKHVICVSDSYLSSNQVAMILEHHGLSEYIDRLYISCSIGKRKSTGILFQHVISQEGIKLVHTGDDYISDYIMPRKLGIRSLWLRSTREAQRKKRLRKLFSSRNKLNYVNAVIRTADTNDSALNDIGYEVLGPALTIFVQNVAEQARRDGIETLFFVARDGYVMKKIYDLLHRSIYGLDAKQPTGKYMCLSRFPVRLASLHQLTWAELSEVYSYLKREPGKPPTMGDVLRSYSLDPSDFLGVANRFEVDMDRPIDSLVQDTNAKLHGLLRSDEFQEIVRDRSNEMRRLLRQYLSSIGFIGKRHVAVVDGNSEGITQSLLDQAFIEDKDYPRVTRYYFNVLKLNVRSQVDLDLPQVRGVVSDWRKDSEKAQAPFILLGMLIELLTHPNHGVTIGYREINGRITPIFRKTPQESQYQATSQVLRGILSYARDYGTYYNLHNCECEELLDNMKGKIREWVAVPPRSHAEALKGLSVTFDWPQEHSRLLVNQVEFKDILAIRPMLSKIMSSIWAQGTLRLVPLPGLNWLFYKIVVRARNLPHISHGLE